MNKIRIFERLQYIVFILLIVGQITIGKNYVLGQCTYLAANVISVTRCFILKRPKADKVKDFGCTGITIGCLVATFI